MFDRILIAVDGSGHADKALRVAIELALRFGARLTVLSVYRHYSNVESSLSLVRVRNGDLPPPDETLKQVSNAVVDDAVGRARAAGVEKVYRRVRRGPPARTIVREAARDGADAIVLGSRGLGDIGGILLGSVSHKVTSLAECTVITVK